MKIKKILGTILASVLVFSLTACNQDITSSNASSNTATVTEIPITTEMPTLAITEAPKDVTPTIVPTIAPSIGSTVAPTKVPTEKNTVKENAKSTYEYAGNTYRIIEVDGGNLSGDRQPNVAVDIGFGDREYWALTNEYGQLVYVIADKIIPQDDSSEPVNSKGRYYDDEAKVPGTELKEYDEGHVIADSLGGVSNAYNITPQNSTLNRYGDQAYMEKVMRDAGGSENFVATITYPNTTTQIPIHYHFEYVLMGEKIIDDFDNVDPDKVNASIAKKPTKIPTKAPAKTSTKTPTKTPTKAPTKAPAKASTKAPTKTPTKAPTKTPKKESKKDTFNEKTELSKIDTNGNGKVTIAEAKAAGYKDSV